jgi:hypothetical protein
MSNWSDEETNVNAARTAEVTTDRRPNEFLSFHLDGE